MKFTNTKVLLIISSILLFFALLDGLAYGYFTFLRFAVFAVSFYVAYSIYKVNNDSFWPWIYGAVGVLFNPFIIIHLERETWVVIDLIVGIFFVLSAFLIKSREKGEN